MLNEEAQLQQVEHLLDSLEPRQRMPFEYLSELVAQISEIVANGFGIHGIVKELDDPRILALVEPYAFARLAYVYNDKRVSIVDGSQGRAIRRARVPRRGGSPEFGCITPEIEVDPAVVPVRLLVLENAQLILRVPGAFALRTPVYWDGVKVNDLKRNPVLRAVHAGLRWQRCARRCPFVAREEAPGQCVPTMRMYLPSKSNQTGVTCGLPFGMTVARLANAFFVVTRSRNSGGIASRVATCWGEWLPIGVAA